MFAVPSGVRVPFLEAVLEADCSLLFEVVAGADCSLLEAAADNMEQVAQVPSGVRLPFS